MNLRLGATSLELQKYTVRYGAEAGEDLGSMKVIQRGEGGYMQIRLGLRRGGLKAVTVQASRPTCSHNIQPAQQRRECSRLR